jgi:hypothetical protein
MFSTLLIPRVKMFTAFLESYIKYHAFLLVISSGVVRMELDFYRAIIDSFLARRPKVRVSEQSVGTFLGIMLIVLLVIGRVELHPALPLLPSLPASKKNGNV